MCGVSLSSRNDGFGPRALVTEPAYLEMAQHGFLQRRLRHACWIKENDGVVLDDGSNMKDRQDDGVILDDDGGDTVEFRWVDPTDISDL